MSEAPSIRPATVMRLDRPDTVWLATEPVPVDRTGAGRPVARLVTDPLRLEVGGRARAEALAAIDRWYRREARRRIGALVASEGERLDLRPGRLRIGNQRTRWGSCSTSGTLSFNWRLVLGEPEALRYVIVHELVHLRHPNHSRRFWNDLAAAMPDWRPAAAWLKANQRPLLAWQPRI